MAELERRAEGDVYRIELGPLAPDPRVALRKALAADEGEIQSVLKRLHRFDSRPDGHPWTKRTLEVLQSHPGVRAGDLCELVGQQKAQFKLNVRKLKALGLTESLETGYRLSPRGQALLDRLRSASAQGRT